MTDDGARFYVRNELIRSNAAEFVSALEVSDDRPWLVEIKLHKPNRSLAQNRLYWWWLRQIAEHVNGTGVAQVADRETGEVHGHTVTTQDLHDWFRHSFLGRRAVEMNGRIYESARSTTTLTVNEFTDYLTKIEVHCQERMGLVLPHPMDYAEAMGINR